MKKILLLALTAVSLTSYAQDALPTTKVTAIENFQPESYLGKWYEIARIPFYFEEHCKAPVTANYTLDGKNLAVTNSCATKDGKIDVAHGMGYFTESTPNIAKLEVTFVPSWLRFTHIGRGDYWVLYTDYQYSLVGSPNHKYLWILSRSETIESASLDQLLAIAKEQGFDTTKLLFNYPRGTPTTN